MTKRFLARSFVAVAVMSATVAIGAPSAIAATGNPATSTSTSVFGLPALAFAQSHVDSRVTDGVDTLTWTITDSDTTATGIGGKLLVSLEAADGSLVGVPIPIQFAYENDLYQGAQFVSGTPQKSKYTFDFPVPQWAAQKTGIWVVSRMVVRDDTHSVDKPISAFGTGYKDTVTAKELVDSVNPTNGSVDFSTNTSLVRHPYVFLGATGGDAPYEMSIQDGQSGVWKGSVQFTGPTKQKILAPFEVTTSDDSTGYSCGYLSGGDITEQYCGITVHFPAGSAPGVWKPTKVTVTDNVGNTAVDSVPQGDPVTLTTDSTVQASNFTFTPDPLNDWAGGLYASLTMSVSGAVGGVSAIYVEATAESNCLQFGPAVTVNADGTVSTSVYVYQGGQTCAIEGIAVVDGAGNVALYGTEYGLADLGVKIQQIPDTGPVVSAATLSQTTIAQADLATTPVTLTTEFTAPSAPITGFDGYVLNSDG